MEVVKKNPPNILLRGCTRSEEATRYIHTAILDKSSSSVRPREEEISIPGFSASKSAKILRWPWGIQIWVTPYRTRSDKWWDTLLSLLSTRSAITDASSVVSVKIILLCAVDTAPSQIQMVFRARLEDDYQTARYILTCAADTYLERSLESRCVVMLPTKEDRWDDAVLYLDAPSDGIVSWSQVKNAWLADIPAFRVLDAIFEPQLSFYAPRSTNRKSITLAWCRYADLLKSCYQEITILRQAWEWIQVHHKTHKKERARGKSSE